MLLGLGRVDHMRRRRRYREMSGKATMSTNSDDHHHHGEEDEEHHSECFHGSHLPELEVPTDIGGDLLQRHTNSTGEPDEED